MGLGRKTKNAKRLAVKRKLGSPEKITEISTDKKKINDREKVKKWRNNQTTEQRENRLSNDRAYKARRFEQESIEERETRLIAAGISKKIVKAKNLPQNGKSVSRFGGQYTINNEVRCPQ